MFFKKNREKGLFFTFLGVRSPLRTASHTLFKIKRKNMCARN